MRRTPFRLAVAGVSLATLASLFVLATSAAAAGSIEIPAGATATLSGGEFCADDSLTYGYQLNGGADQPLATDGGDEQCETGLAGATIGPVSGPTTLLVYLTDNYSTCNDTYYSDGTGSGPHADVTQESTDSWEVSIADCGDGHDMTDTRIPGAGDGNLNVTVTVVPAAPPGVSIVTPPDGAFYSAGQSVLANFSCSEGAGGPGLLASGGCVGTVASGAAIDTSTLGSHSFTVTATSQDGQSTTDTVNYTVAAPPTASISAPSGGGVYAQGAVVATTFSCTDGTDGPGLAASGGCVDNNGGSGTGGHLNTSALGTNQSYTVTATSQDGQTDTATITYTVAAAPSVTITTPPDGAYYSQGQSVPASYSCSEGAGGPGLTVASGCAGTVASGAAIDTSSPGGHSFSVTATSQDGASTTDTVNYTVAAPPSESITTPGDGAVYSQGQSVPASYSCSEGAGGPGLTVASGCAGTVASGAAIDTSTLGGHSFTVTATSQDGQSTTDTVNYAVASPPSVTIATPPDGAAYSQGQSVAAAYSCSEGAGGPGLLTSGGCVGTVTDGSAIDTSSLGSHSFSVTATSQDGQSTTDTVNYAVAAPPSASITTPAANAYYAEGASVIASYTCSEGVDGPGLTVASGCAGTVASGAAIDTSTLGSHSFTVTATSQDGQSTTDTVTYTVAAAPTATITTPANNQSYTFNQAVPTSFACTEGAHGPGLASCTDSNGATSRGALVTSTVGSFSYTVTAKSSDGQSATATIDYEVAYVDPTNTARPEISGNPQQGQTLDASTGTWSGDPTPTYTYQWERCSDGCANIDGARASSYLVSVDDIGYALEVDVTATNPGAAVTVSSDQTDTVITAPPANQGLPQVIGTAQAGQTLSATQGNWLNSPTSYDYQWLQCDSTGANCVQIKGAQTNSYMLANTDVGHTLSVVVTATNAGGNSSAMSPPSAVVSIGAPVLSELPAILGTAQQAKTLSTDGGSWTNAPTSFTYQWLQCDASGANCGQIGGAMASSYVPDSGDVGQTLRVAVVAINSSGNASATSGPSAVVLIAPPANTAPPAVSGPPVQSQALSASTGGWMNSPTTYTYQWLQCDSTGAGCTLIKGAIASSYVPGPGDDGHALRVIVTATNATGTTSATSFPTEAIVGLQNSPPPPPVLDSSTNLNPVGGTILVRLPGSSTFTPVPTGTNVPIGSTVDAIHGTVSITVALPNGNTQTGEFYDGEFVLTQSKGGTTIPVLTGGSFNGCPTGTKSGSARDDARAAGSKKKAGTVVRQLWGNAHGNYTTKGRYGSASVSGTIWLVQDRCDGTYIKATKDNVFVVAYAHPNKKYNVKQGQHILIPPPGS
jgi:hypothetical protein